MAILKSLLCLFFLLSNLAYADFFPGRIDYGRGGMIYPVENDCIEMTQASITIDAYAFHYRYHYTCKFLFTNVTDKEQTVTMGFPIKFSHFESAYELQDLHHDYDKIISNFEVYLDKEPIDCEISILDPDYNNITYEDYVYNYRDKYDIVYYFELTFKPHEIKTIVNSYECSYEEYQHYYDSPRNEVYYILKTGRYWYNTIRNLDITVNFEKMPYELFAFSDYRSLGMTMNYEKGTGSEKVKLIFQKQNYEPDKDLEIMYSRNKLDSCFQEYLQKKNYRRLEFILDYINEVNLFSPFYFRPSHATEDHLLYILKFINMDWLRKGLFRTANDLWKTAPLKAITYFKRAFIYIDSNIIGNDPRELLEADLDSWKPEAADTAPSYYIAYNLACLYSLSNELSAAEDWLRIAIRINPEVIKPLIKKDKDLGNLKQNTEIYNSIITEEPMAVWTERDASLAHLEEQLKILLFENRNFLADHSTVTENTIKLLYIPEDFAPHGVIVCYAAKEESEIKVRYLKSGNMSTDLLAEGKAKVKKGRGIIIVALYVTKESGWNRLPMPDEFGVVYFTALMSWQSGTSIKTISDEITKDFINQ